jgi:hypothetical protein
MRNLLGLTLLFASFATSAVTLFGVDPATVGRAELRTAALSSGAKSIGNAATGAPFEIFRAQELLPGAETLYLGFDPESGAWAFAEYEFIGLEQPSILGILRAKYGNPEVTEPGFISDTAYHWQVDGVQISLYQDWPAYRMRLLYQNPAMMPRLRAAFSGSKLLDDPKQAANF